MGLIRAKTVRMSEYQDLGIQPARLVLMQRRIGVAECADAIGANRSHLGRVLAGHYPASRLMKAAVSQYLGLSEAECFVDQRQPVGVP
jgi:hypothetical protein